MTMQKKFTIYDIAKKSGFSPKTVSRVINGGHRVKQETKEIMDRVIEELSYIPNTYAKNLSRKQTTNILISVKKMDSFPLIWFQTLLDKLLISCKEMGVNAIVEYFGEDNNIYDSIVFSAGGLVDGVIVFYESERDVRIDFMKKNNIPFIVFGKTQCPNVTYVDNSDYEALYMLMEYFTKRRHRLIWLLMGGTSIPFSMI